MESSHATLPSLISGTEIVLPDFSFSLSLFCKKKVWKKTEPGSNRIQLASHVYITDRRDLERRDKCPTNRGRGVLVVGPGMSLSHLAGLPKHSPATNVLRCHSAVARHPAPAVTGASRPDATTGARESDRERGQSEAIALTNIGLWGYGEGKRKGRERGGGAGF